MHKNGGWQICEIADYLYSVAILVNSFQNNMVEKMVWQINRGWINNYSLYNTNKPYYIHITRSLYTFMHTVSSHSVVGLA